MPQIFKIGSYTVYFWSNEGKPLDQSMVHIAEGTCNMLLEQKSGLPVQEKLSSQKIPPIFHSKFYEVS